MSLPFQRLWRLLKRSILTLILLLLIVAGLFLLPSVQTWAARQVVGVLHDKADLDIEIGSLQYNFPNSVVIRELTLRDNYQDTVIHIGFLSTRLKYANRSFSSLRFGPTNFDQLDIYLHRQEGDSLNGFQYFLDKLKSDDTSASAPFELKIGVLHMERIRFRMWKDACPDCFHISWPKAELNAKGVVISKDSIGARFQHISFIDPERFDLKHFEGEAHFADNSSGLSKWLMLTDSSRVEGDVDLFYPEIESFKNFIQEVKMDVTLADTRLSFHEAHSFLASIPELPTLGLEMDATGTLDSLIVSHLIADPDGRTYIKLKGEMNALSSSNGPELDLDIDLLESNSLKLHRIFGLLGQEKSYPTLLDSLGQFEMKGNYRGDKIQYAFNGLLNSELGDLEADARFSRDTSGRGRHTLKGNLRFDKLRLDKLSGEKTLGFAKGGLLVDARFRPKGIPQGRIKGALSEIEWRGQKFSNINLDGVLERENFTGSVNIIDPRVDFQFFGTADLSLEEGSYDFQARLKKLDLAELGWVEDSIGILSSRLSFKAKGSFPEQWEGRIQLLETTYEDPMHFYFFNEMELTSEVSDSNRRLRLNSEVFTLDASGDFKPSALPKFLTNYLNRYTGGDSLKTNSVKSFNLSAEIYRPDILNDLIFPKLYIEPGAKLQSSYNDQEDLLRLNVSSQYISYEDLDFTEISIENRESDDGLLLQIGNLNYGQREFENISLLSDHSKDSLELRLKGTLLDTVNAKFELATQLLRPEDTTYQFYLMPSSFQYGNYTISNAGVGEVVVEPQRVALQGLEFQSSEGLLFVNGNISSSPYQILRLSFSDFEVGVFNPYLSLFDTDVKGQMNGEIIMSQLLSDPKYGLNLQTKNSSINGLEMGDLELHSDWSQYTGVIDLDGRLKKGSLQKLVLNGRFYPDSLYSDMILNLNRFDLGVLQPYTKGIFSRLRGYAEGELSLCGVLGELSVSGELELPNAAFTIPILNTDYNLQGSPKVLINDKSITLEKTVIVDTREGTNGTAEMTIQHNHFQQMNLDLQIQADHLLCLNTTSEMSPFYYGTAYGTGLIKLGGTPKELRLEVDAKVERGTIFSIPMGGPKEIVGSSFITFKEPDRLILENYRQNGNLRQEQKTNPLEIYFDLEVTPEAELEIIVDEQNGDLMRGRGKGQIQLEISREGEVQMLGGVTVQSGYYIFTLTGIVSRRFDLVQGGTIRWNGTPYDSQIDLKAVYNTRLSLGPVLEEYKGVRTDLELYLVLREELMNPSIGFEIKAPQATSDAQAKLDNYFADIDRLNRQAFSILSMNTLLAEDGANSGGGVFTQSNLTNNTYQVLTSQVSNWLNSGVNFIDINVNYVGSEDPGVTSDEFEVGLSKKLMNDRLTINGEFDVPVGESQNPNQQQVLVGDVELVYDITPDGRFKARVFNENNDQLNGQITTTYTQGLGIFYTTDFQTFPDLVRKIFGIKPKVGDEEQTNEVD